MLTAQHLLAALESKHAGDFIVSECKDGPTTTRNHRQLDAWALLPTWSPVTTYGYEIKVSRSDFLRDTKWESYLSLCHLLYLVAPKGIIQLGELPEGVGLIEALQSGNGRAKLVTRRKAIRRSIEIPVNLMLYVLMYRAQPCGSRYGTAAVDPRERWRKACEDRDDLGRLVKTAIRDQWRALEDRARRAEAKSQGYERIRARLTEMGFDPDKPISEWGLDKQLRQAVDAVPQELLASLGYAITTLTDAKRHLSDLVDKGKRLEQSA
jgi:hypothetical protein